MEFRKLLIFVILGLFLVGSGFCIKFVPNDSKSEEQISQENLETIIITTKGSVYIESDRDLFEFYLNPDKYGKFKEATTKSEEAELEKLRVEFKKIVPKTDIFTKSDSEIKEAFNLLKNANFENKENKYGYYKILEDYLEVKNKQTLTEKNINDKIENYKDNPLDFSSEAQAYMTSQGVNPSTTALTTIYDQQIKQQEIINTKCTTETDECKKAKDYLEKSSKFLDSMSETAKLSYISSNLAVCNTKNNCDQLNSILKKQDCGTGWSSGICNFFNFKSNEMFLEQQTALAISKATRLAVTSDDYNEVLREVVANQFPIKKVQGVDININDIPETIKNLENKKEICPECQTDINNALAILKVADKKTMVKTNTAYSIIDAIKNPDQNALKTAKFFGFEANYENVPVMLRESLPSQMCLDKIDGYLDKEVETNGGVTKYNDQIGDLQVLGDLRAQRSTITPDNKTLITYSYYVKNPKNPFSLTVKYVENGNWKVFTLENSSKSKNMDSVLIPLENAVKVEPNSFTINLNSGDLQLTYPIILISTSSLTSTIQSNGNAAGNEGANINANING